VEMLGLASYPTYLFHGPLLLLVGSAILRWKLVSDWRLTWLILVSVGISTGIALGYLAERPIMNRRAAFLSRLRSQRTPPARGDVKVPVLSIQQ
jgi:peptidoglycan/LPS O-acetylase OafA/YrhL